MCFQVKSSKVFTPTDFTLSNSSWLSPHLTGLTVPLIQLREVHIEQRGLDVELNSEWPVAEQEVERQHIDQVRTAIEVPQSRLRR